MVDGPVGNVLMRKFDIVFRADASLKIGTGHVMRCLALADALRLDGATCTFICRPLEGDLLAFIKDRGYEAHALSYSTLTIEDSTIQNLVWQQDTMQTCELLAKLMPDLLVVDHYELDFQWECAVKVHSKKLMVIDDLANRKHQCDILLDQTYGRDASEYKALVPIECEVLLGAKYALLRPDFEAWRHYSLSRRAKTEFKQLLISMGGVDPDNFTGEILRSLQKIHLSANIQIVVIMGPAAPWLQQVKQLAAQMPNTKVLIGVTNMAEIMANSDLAIGAAGGTTWERCCLGLPSVQMVLADNQKYVDAALTEIHAAISLNRETLNKLEDVVKAISNKLQKLAIISSSISDGSGVSKIVSHIFNLNPPSPDFELKPAKRTDSSYIYGLQIKPNVRQFFRNPSSPSLPEHEKWFDEIINSDNHVLFIICFGGINVGMLRVDALLSEALEISIIIDPQFSGKGLGKRTINELLLILPSRKIKAVIHSENLASKYLFEKSGFIFQASENDFLTYTRGS
jgi:UDP-2,4-diacetamido-2,4,6-trideoxy-beta-L-altropyranose hydrolase